MLDIIDENKVWTLEIAIGETADETEAQARLRVDDTEIEGWGRARRRPGDPQRPRVGEESQSRGRCRTCRTDSSTRHSLRSRSPNAVPATCKAERPQRSTGRDRATNCLGIPNPSG
jgi:hypothetical protein